MPNFTLYELSVLANAVQQQRSAVTEEYLSKVQPLDQIDKKLRQEIDSLKGVISEELVERGFFVNGGFNDE